MRDIQVMSGPHQFKCRVEGGKVTVHPSQPFSGEEGFLTDDRVPIDVAVRFSKSESIDVRYITSTRQLLDQYKAKFPNETIQNVLKTGRGPWDKPPIKLPYTSPGRKLVLDHCNWPGRGAAGRIYPKGKFMEQHVKKEFLSKCWPPGVLFIEAGDMGQAQYIAGRLEAGSLPSLPPECLVRSLKGS